MFKLPARLCHDNVSGFHDSAALAVRSPVLPFRSQAGAGELLRSCSICTPCIQRRERYVVDRQADKQIGR